MKQIAQKAELDNAKHTEEAFQNAKKADELNNMLNALGKSKEMAVEELR